MLLPSVMPHWVVAHISFVLPGGFPTLPKAQLLLKMPFSALSPHSQGEEVQKDHTPSLIFTLIRYVCHTYSIVQERAGSEADSRITRVSENLFNRRFRLECRMSGTGVIVLYNTN